MIGSIPDFVDFASARGVSVTPEKAVVAMVQAADLLNRQCWVGEQDENSDDAWPRTGLIFNGRPLLDVDGTKIKGLSRGDYVEVSATPLSVLNAYYALALDASQGVKLQPTVAGPQIVEQRVEGAIDIKYQAESLGVAPVFPWWDDLLGPWLECDSHKINFSVYRG